MSYPYSPTVLLPTVDGAELESALLHLQAALGDSREDWLIQPDAWAKWPQDPRSALLKPTKEVEDEDAPWEEEVLLRTQRGDLVAQELSLFPRGHFLEGMNYNEGDERDDGGRRNEALTSIAGGLQAVREKGGFGFRFGRKR